ncbi:MAG: gliding motility-associated C-terminal domain-containing protein [Chitinophagaceae bacterium]|nr:gliding motility-associated C-terminal domain-containing protein [Chitinophagaceae bacterium]
MRVYNDWGQQVFSTTLTDRGWDGTINGVTQDGGVYIWVVKATTIKNQVIEKKGTCLLIR